MVDCKKLRGVLAERGISQAKMAKMLEMTPKTFYTKMSKQVFASDEIEIMIKALNISPERCVEIFFASNVT